MDAGELRTQEGKFARKFGAKFREKTRSAYYSKVLSKYCCNALQKYSKSVSSTQVTILSPLPVETSMNVWLLMWYEEPGVWVSVQTTTQSLQARGTWAGRHFLWLTYSYNNRWNSRFVGETLREEAWRKLFTTMATLGIPMLRRQCSHSFIDLVAFWSLLCQK